MTHFCKCIKNKLIYYIYISIQTHYSVIFWSTSGSVYSLESSWVWRYKPGPPVFGKFLPVFAADSLNLCQIGWGASLHSNFQVSPEMFERVRGRALAGPLKDIRPLVPNPLLRCLGCVRRVAGLLWGPERSGAGFHQGSLRLSFPRSWLVSQSLLLKNIPTAWFCHHYSVQRVHFCFSLSKSPFDKL